MDFVIDDYGQLPDRSAITLDLKEGKVSKFYKAGQDQNPLYESPAGSSDGESFGRKSPAQSPQAQWERKMN